MAFGSGVHCEVSACWCSRRIGLGLAQTPRNYFVVRGLQVLFSLSNVSLVLATPIGTIMQGLVEAEIAVW